MIVFLVKMVQEFSNAATHLLDELTKQKQRGNKEGHIFILATDNASERAFLRFRRSTLGLIRCLEVTEVCVEAHSSFGEGPGERPIRQGWRPSRFPVVELPIELLETSDGRRLSGVVSGRSRQEGDQLEQVWRARVDVIANPFEYRSTLLKRFSAAQAHVFLHTGFAAKPLQGTDQ